jgi:TetR/AcrR family transcriptional regulator, transcriptional repressor for nem operon
MRQSREVAVETRRKIVKVAARQFRKHGIGGIAIADVMAKAGLTHGGFYKHFASKDQLAAEACTWALATSRQELIAAAQAAPAGREVDAIAATYLSMAHRDHPDWGCVIAALGAESARLDAGTRGAVAGGYNALVELVAAHLPKQAGANQERRAQAIVALMVGALRVSRSIADPAAAERVLEAGRLAISGFSERRTKNRAKSH